MVSGLFIVVLALAVYNVHMSWRIVRDDGFSSTQKTAQLVFVWLIPLVGAILVHWVSVAQSRQRDAPSRKFAAYDDYQGYEKSPNVYDDP